MFPTPRFACNVAVWSPLQHLVNINYASLAFMG
jgi:hypothetical protein